MIVIGLNEKRNTKQGTTVHEANDSSRMSQINDTVTDEFVHNQQQKENDC